MIQLLIDSHAQCLKHLGRRMMPASAATLDLLNNLNEISGSFQWPSLSFSDDCLRNAPRLRFFAVIPKDPFQLALRRGVDDPLSIYILAAIHAHIQPRRRAKTEPAFRSVNVMGRNA